MRFQSILCQIIKVYPGMLEYCLSLRYKKVGETCIALFFPKVSKSPKKLLQDSQALPPVYFPTLTLILY